MAAIGSGGARGPGERGRSIIPNHAAAGVLAEGCAPQFVGPAESSRHGEVPQRVPQPLPGDQPGHIKRLCLLCRKYLEPVPCLRSDPQNGHTSHVYCDGCKPKVTREYRQEMGLALDCEACGAQLEIDGVCPSCHVGHDGARCMDCGRVAMHRSDCATIQPPTIEELLADAHLTGLGLKPLPGGVL
jgi:hypothetical protein